MSPAMKAGVTDRLWSINLTTTVPLNMNVLRAMRRSPLGIDLYLWLTLTLTTFRILQKKKSLKLYWASSTSSSAPSLRR